MKGWVTPAWVVLVLSTAAARAAGAPTLDLPIACTLERDCYVQNYVDHDTGPGAADYHCGRLTYDGHKGTDFAVRDLAAMRRGFAVLAAAAGRVLRIRDGMPDAAVTGQRAAGAAVAGRECGNGVVIGHGDGWETQYCHMRSGSIAVQPGQRVVAGAHLGLVGLSGETAFPHVHFELRHAGAVVDPFDGAPMTAPCDALRHSLWRRPIAYHPSGAISAGFAAGRPSFAGARAGNYDAAVLPADAPALVAWVRFYGVRRGDRIAIGIAAPDRHALLTVTGDPLPRDQAEHFQFAGARRHTARWPAGTYRGEFRLLRPETGAVRTVVRAGVRIEVR